MYDAMAADYAAAEDNPYNAYYEQPNLRALLPAVAGRRVLDAGCGAGRTCEWLVEQGAEVVGIDASPEMLGRARERVPAASFALADLANPLAFEDGSFDIAVAGLVMHYLRDWVPTLRELRRVLRPDGVFVLSTHHPAVDAELSDSGD
jgi:SAM-dependent methyltransferase